jgi:hypothetical protein
MLLNELKGLNKVNIYLLLTYIINGINSKSIHATEYMIILQASQTCILIEIKHMHILIFENVVTPTTKCKPSMNLPPLDLAAHHAQWWVTLEMGPSSTQGKEILD